MEGTLAVGDGARSKVRATRERRLPYPPRCIHPQFTHGGRWSVGYGARSNSALRGDHGCHMRHVACIHRAGGWHAQGMACHPTPADARSVHLVPQRGEAGAHQDEAAGNGEQHDANQGERQE